MPAQLIRMVREFAYTSADKLGKPLTLARQGALERLNADVEGAGRFCRKRGRSYFDGLARISSTLRKNAPYAIWNASNMAVTEGMTSRMVSLG